MVCAANHPRQWLAEKSKQRHKRKQLISIDKWLEWLGQVCVATACIDVLKIVEIRYDKAHVSDKTWYRYRLLTYWLDCFHCDEIGTWLLRIHSSFVIVIEIFPAMLYMVRFWCWVWLIVWQRKQRTAAANVCGWLYHLTFFIQHLYCIFLCPWHYESVSVEMTAFEVGNWNRWILFVQFGSFNLFFFRAPISVA